MAVGYSGSGQYSESASSPATGLPLTLAAWFYVANQTANHTILSVNVTAGSSNNRHVIAANGLSAGDPLVAATTDTGGASSLASTGIAYSANTWQHAIGVFAANNDRRVYLNGANKATSASTRTPSGSLSRIYVGANGAGGALLNGRVAEAAIWAAVLTDDEAEALGSGVSPRLIRPESLVFWAPLVTSESPQVDLIGGRNLTNTGSPTTTDHPSIAWPRVAIGAGF
jgi:hypothetical protein